MYISLYKNYLKILYYDLSYKYHFASYFKIPRLVDLYFIFSFHSSTLIQILYSLCFFEFIVQQKPCLIQSRKIKFQFKIIKTDLRIFGCKVNLRGLQLNSFLSLFLFLYLPRLNSFDLIFKNALQKINKNIFSLVLPDLLMFKEMELLFKAFQHMEKLTLLFLFTHSISWDYLISFLYFKTLPATDIIELNNSHTPQSMFLVNQKVLCK